MQEIPAIFCDIDGVVTQKFDVPDYENFGAPNLDMVRVLESLGRDFTIVFITGRWAVGQAQVEKLMDSLLPNVKKCVFCKPREYLGSTADYKLSKIAELEAQGYKFYLGLDDRVPVIGLLRNHGMFVAQVVSD